MKIAQLLLAAILLCSCTTKKDPEIAYQISERDLIPEGIAWSEKHHKLYLTSIHKSKIVEIDMRNGSFRDFIITGQYGFPSGVGMVADDKTNRLFALGNHKAAGKQYAGLFVFDMTTRKLINKYLLETPEGHFFNDCVLDKENRVYITDTEGSKIYMLHPDSTRLFPVISGNEILYPNGITISPDNRKLYIASYVRGVRIFDLVTQSFLNEADTSQLTRGIDGLKYYKNSLIGVQNGFRDSMRIVRLHLDDQGAHITGVSTLDANNPYFEIPTTGVVAKDDYYVIANSQLPDLDQSVNQIIDSTRLSDTYLLKYNLKNR